MTIITIFIIIQTILLFFITLHDWVHLPPLTNIRELEKHSTTKGRLIGSTVLFLTVFIPLLLTALYQPNFPFWVLVSLSTIYGMISLGTIFSGWVPYIFGSSEKHKANFVEY